jgi:hypothetical protein
MNCDAVPVAADVRKVGIGLQREFLFEDGNRETRDMCATALTATRLCD